MLTHIKTGKSLIVLVLLIPFLTIVSYILHVQISESKTEVFEIMQNYVVNEKIALMKNLADHLVKESAGIDIDFLYSFEYANHYDEELKLIKSSKDEYIYLLYKDAKGKFRYL